GPALQFAFAVFLFGVAWRLAWLLFLPGASDKSVARPGAPSAVSAAIKGFARHMWLPGPVTQSSMFALVNGYVFHIGLAIIVFGFGPHILVIDGLFGLHWPNLPSGMIQLVSVITLASLVAALVRRLTSPVLRLLSTANDYFSWLVTITPVATGLVAVSHLGARYETLLAIHLLSVAALLIWFPFGKLMHAFLVFLTRTRTGVFYGRRGVEI
ncbi:MAG: hypothetical protein WAU86_15720, partial [Oricola sp.]